MANNYFITGMPKAGKTTLLQKLVGEMKGKGIRVGGFLSPEEKVHGTRTGFKVQDVETGKRATLAAIDVDGPKVSKYHVNIKSFEWLALPILKDCGKYDVVVIDEIGRMEMKSARFQECLERLLESEVPLIASLHRDYIEDYRTWGEVLILTPSNRGRLYMDLLRKAEQFKAPEKKVLKAKKEKRPKAKKKKPERKRAGKKKKPKKEPFKRKKPKKPKPLEEEEDKMAHEIVSHKGERKEKKEKPKEEKKEKPKEEKKGGFRDWVREHVGI